MLQGMVCIEQIIIVVVVGPEIAARGLHIRICRWGIVARTPGLWRFLDGVNGTQKLKKHRNRTNRKKINSGKRTRPEDSYSCKPELLTVLSAALATVPDPVMTIPDGLNTEMERTRPPLPPGEEAAGEEGFEPASME